MLTHLHPTRAVGHPRTSRSLAVRLRVLGRGLRAALLVAAVFSLAMLVGGVTADLTAQLVAAEPDPLNLVADEIPTTPATAEEDRPRSHRVFALSLIYTGAVALLTSLAGMVIVARRRRQW